MSSSYPGALDALPTTHQDDVNEVVHAATVNDLADAVNKIEAELGINPSGGYASLVARLVAIETALAAQPPAGTVWRSFVGVCSSEPTIVARMGIYNIRIDIGFLDKSDIDYAAENNISVIPIACYNPWNDLAAGWASDKTPPDTTAHRTTWAQRMMADIVSKFTTPPEAIEVWNEPWVPGNWGGAVNGANYHDLVYRFTQVCWATPGYANCKILWCCDKAGTFGTDVIAADTGGVAVLNDPRCFPTTHNYCGDDTPDHVSGNPDEWDFQRYTWAYNAAKAHGHTDPKVWVTEFGWWSDTPNGDPDGHLLVTEANQAAYTKQALQMAYTSGKVMRAFVYYVNGQGDINDLNWIRPDLTDKPIAAEIGTFIATGA